MTTETDTTLVAYESGNPMNLEPGIYAAKVNSIEEVDGQYGLQWRFEFGIDNSEDTPWAWATAKLGTKTKLYGWATALLGRPLSTGERLTRQQLIGLPCNVIIKERADPEAVDGMRRYVDDILKVKAPTAPTASISTTTRDKIFAAMNATSLSVADVALILGCEHTKVAEAVVAWVKEAPEEKRTAMSCMGYVSAGIEAATATPAEQEPLPMEGVGLEDEIE